ncbi:MAG: putative bifunctional diguanylate cyclase/phosphodiesterase [Janthinobacterium lividum]
MKRFTRFRLLFGSLLTVCLFATLSSTLLTLHSAGLNHQNTIALVPLLEQAEGFERDILNARISYIYYVTVDKPGSLEVGWKHYHQAEASLKILHQLAAESGQSQMLAPRFEALDEAWTAYRNRLDSTLSIVQSGEHSGLAYNQAISEWAAAGTTLVNAARELVQTSTALSRAEGEQTGDLLGLSTWIIGINGLVCMLLCVVSRIFPGTLGTNFDINPVDGAGSEQVVKAERGTSTSRFSELWKDASFSGKVVVGLGSMLVLITVVLGAGISAVRGVVRLNSAHASNMHSEQVQLRVASLRAFVYSAESDTRGYVFTGRQTLLVSQKTDMQAAWRVLDKLAKELESDPGKKNYVDQIAHALRQRFDILQLISRTREASGPEAVVGILAGGESLQLKHQLEEQFLSLESAEDDSITNKSLEAERAAAMSKALIVFAALPASLSLILLSIVTAHLLVRSKRLQQQLTFQAEHDLLTGLPNRQCLDKHVSDLLRQARKEGTGFAMFGIDLDRFKEVNDRFGHHNGDIFLQQVSNRLRSVLRQSDVLLRVGGDEFLGLLPNVRRKSDAESVAKKLMSSLTEEIRLQGSAVTASVSIGYAIFPDHGDSGAALAMHADQALYRAKKAGRGTFSCFEESESEIRAQAVQESLHSALKEKWFHLVYQPQYTPQGTLRGFEALLRLTDPQLGAISPAEFIPIAERNSLIIEVGDWVLAEACATFANWINAGFEPGILAINVSAAQFIRKDLPNKVLNTLKSSGLAGTRLELELTESLVMSDSESASCQMIEMRQHGVRFAIDDFGTGYSSLSRLNQLPIATLKIDCSFTQGLDKEASSRPIVEATLALARALHVETVAEGVETESQHALLQALGCSYLQGFLLSRPLDRLVAEEGLLARRHQTESLLITENAYPSLIM